MSVAQPQQPTGSALPGTVGAGVSAVSRRSSRASRIADAVFYGLVWLCAVCVVAIVGFILLQLIKGSDLALAKFGWKFFTGSDWDPVNGSFGAVPFIYGTLVSSLVALVIAIPLSLGVAIFITEMCPRGLRGILSYLTELLAAIPSVIYGLWAIFVLVPLIMRYFGPALEKTLGWTGLFGGPVQGFCMFTAGVVLSIMIIPIISSITREILTAVPHQQREAALALGATRWEMIRVGVLRNARAGISGAIILGLGRALGETMAVTMVIGNSPQIVKSLFAPAYTMASVIANEFSEATYDLYTSALIEIGLALFIVTIIVNILAQVLIWTVTRGTPRRASA